MNKKWDQSVYGSWHNYQNELILMFLWGIQTPDLVNFLTPINDVKGKDSEEFLYGDTCSVNHTV